MRTPSPSFYIESYVKSFQQLNHQNPSIFGARKHDCRPWFYSFFVPLALLARYKSGTNIFTISAAGFICIQLSSVLLLYGATESSKTPPRNVHRLEGYMRNVHSFFDRQTVFETLQGRASVTFLNVRLRVLTVLALVDTEAQRRYFQSYLAAEETPARQN